MANLGRLLWANLRSDLKLIVVWILINTTMIVSGLAKLVKLYGSDADIEKLRQMLDTPMMVALFAKMPTVQYLNVAILLGAVMLPMMGALIGLMSVQLAVRGTRKMEESGETELILATATAKIVPVVAVALELLIVNVVNGLGMYVAWLTIPMPGGSQAGYIVFVGLMVAFGVLMSGLTLIGTQLFADSRSANFFGYGLLAGLYFLRSLIDVKKWDGIAWLSPFNWLEAAKVFENNDSWGVWLMTGLGVVFAIFAIIMAHSRDMGAGLFASTGRGRVTAPATLRGFSTLFLNIQSKLVIGWFVAIIVFAAMFGSIFSNVQELLAGSAQIDKIMGVQAAKTMANTLYAHFLEMIAMFILFFVALMGLNLMQRYNQDSRNGSLDLLSGQPVSRAKLYWTYTLTPLLIGIAVYIVGVIIVWQVANSMISGSLASYQIQRLLGYLPTLTVYIGIGAFVLGWLPKFFSVLYAYYGIFFLLTYLRNMFGFSKWFVRLSPLGWSANIPVTAPDTTIVIGQIIVAIVLLWLGFIGFKKRDLVS